MISPVSFKGTYKIDFAENRGKNVEISNINIVLWRIKKNCKSYPDYPKSLSDSYNITFVTDDTADKYIEKYMASKGINFKKIDTAELLDEKNIKSRIVMPKYKQEPEFQIVEINTQKFNEEYKKHGFAYIGDKNNIDMPQRCTSVEEYLKTGKKIYASEVCIKDTGSYPEIAFQDGRHRYAYYRDTGMKTIPVAMDEKSIAAARKYNLLAD